VLDPGEGYFGVPCTTAVTLAAFPDRGYEFVRWTGTAADGGNVADVYAGETSVLVSGPNQTVVANFAIRKCTLTLSSAEGGAVIRPGEGDFEYDYGSQVTVEARAESGYTFLGWTGSAVTAGAVADPQAAKTTIAVEGDCSAVASFLAQPDIDVPGELKFHRVLVGKAVTHSVAVLNAGTGVLSIARVELSGTTSGAFTISEVPLPTVVPPGGSVSLQVTYAPANLGLDTGELVIECDDEDEGTVGVPLSGEGVESEAPFAPSTPLPPDGATGQPRETTVAWSGGDPDGGDTVTFDVYFGPSSPPPLASAGQGSTTYDPGILAKAMTYYWQVTARDSGGATATGPVWSFTTVENVLPMVSPTCAEIAGAAPFAAAFASNAVDFDGSIVSLAWDFDASDGIGSDSTAENPTFTYAAPGAYEASVAIRDDDGAEAAATTSVTVVDASVLIAAAARIGADGGTVAVSGGALDGAKVIVPAGALRSTIVVVIGSSDSPPAFRVK
jgi:hypothetical protein